MLHEMNNKLHLLEKQVMNSKELISYHESVEEALKKTIE